MTRIIPTPRNEIGANIGLSDISVSGIRANIAAVVAYVFNGFAGERARWALWIPVCLGIGIASYFSLREEPEMWLGPAFFGIAVLAAAVTRHRQALLLPVYAVVFISLGFGIAQLRTALISAPVLQKKLGPVSLEGRVARIEILTKGRRLWLDSISIDRLEAEKTPIRIRIKLYAKKENFRPGDRVRLRAILHPPSGPAMPGAFDFARRAYFQQLGAVGYAISRPAVLSRADSLGFSIWLADLRHRITETIHKTLPGPAGAVAAALITGERGAIPEDVLAAMRESGLAHLLAISGLHMGLVGGLLFFAVRLCLACWESVALRYPIKKWAAGAALLGSLAYLFISGATLPTQRAFLMLSLVMLAVVIDRSAISMNLVAWAAGAILLIAPENLMSVSFQMSFAAVTALVATYELSYTRRLNHSNGNSKLRRSIYYVSAVLLTTLVAGIATAPFALYHFNQVTLLGVVANLFAVPLTALWVMPWAIVAFLLMPFGLAEFALVPMGWGIDAVIVVAKSVQSLPSAVAYYPAMPIWGFALICLGGLWLCLWRLPWRTMGIIPVVLGLASMASVKTPDVLVSETGKLTAVKGSNGLLMFQSRARGFVAETWLRRSGEALSAAGNRTSGKSASVIRCDTLGCILRTGNQTIAFVKNAAALAEDCSVASILISRVPVRKRHCVGPEIVIDRYDLWRAGAHALWFKSDGIDVKTVGNASGNRPWSRYPRTRSN